MDHIVRYTTSFGDDKIEDVGSLDAAIARVEALRNDEGVDNPRLYREVKVEFKTYVRAQVIDDSSSSSPVEAPAAPAAADVEPAPAEPSISVTPPSATPSDPPPGAMPLNPQRPTAKVSDAVDEQGEPSEVVGEEGGERRTLFSRS